MTLSIRFAKWPSAVAVLTLLASPVVAEQSPVCQKTAATKVQRAWLQATPSHCGKAGCIADVVGSRSEADASLAESQVLDRTYALTLCPNAAEPNALPDARAPAEPPDGLSDQQNRR